MSNPLGEFHLPECWNDEIRMNFLFAPLRNRNVNPQDWNAKFTFWSDLIYNYCLSNQVFSFTVSDIKKLFVRNERYPSCLDSVIQEMYTSNQLKTKEELFKKKHTTWSDWVKDVLLERPITWSYQKIKKSLLSNDTEVWYVHEAVINAVSDKLLLSLPENYRNKVITFKEFIEISGYDERKVDNLKIILYHMVNKEQIDIKQTSTDTTDISELSNCLIKFNTGKVKPISEVDISICTLEYTEKRLLDNIEKLEEDSQKCVEEAKIYLNENRKQMAKQSLKKKREIEKTLIKRVNALNNIQSLISQIQGVDSDSEVYLSYQMALHSLQSILKEKNLTEDTVTNTIIELDEVLNVHKDIQTALSQHLTNNEIDSESELEELINSINKPSPSVSPPAQLEEKHQNEIVEQLNALHLDTTYVDTNNMSEKSEVLLS